MGRSLSFAVLAALLLVGAPAVRAAGAVRTLSVRVDSFVTGRVVPVAYAYCIAAKAGHAGQGRDVSPPISWSRGPAGTASYAVVVVDPDVPTVFTDANKEGKVIPASMARRPYYHWLLVDIPRSVTNLPPDAGSKDPAAKPAGRTPFGLTGLNDYGGGRGGYDGPCPPWNDAIVHHYHFQVYALNVARLALPANFMGPDVVRAMQGHILARGEVVGLYSINPAVMRRLPR
jgi:Raf kinase inhibitor-like YbhB/YbcL family protein